MLFAKVPEALPTNGKIIGRKQADGPRKCRPRTRRIRQRRSTVRICTAKEKPGGSYPGGFYVFWSEDC